MIEEEMSAHKDILHKKSKESIKKKQAQTKIKIILKIKLNLIKTFSSSAHTQLSQSAVIILLVNVAIITNEVTRSRTAASERLIKRSKRKRQIIKSKS